MSPSEPTLLTQWEELPKSDQDDLLRYWAACWFASRRKALPAVLTNGSAVSAFRQSAGTNLPVTYEVAYSSNDTPDGPSPTTKDNHSGQSLQSVIDSKACRPMDVQVLEWAGLNSVEIRTIVSAWALNYLRDRHLPIPRRLATEVHSQMMTMARLRSAQTNKE